MRILMLLDYAHLHLHILSEALLLHYLQLFIFVLSFSLANNPLVVSCLLRGSLSMYHTLVTLEANERVYKIQHKLGASNKSSVLSNCCRTLEHLKPITLEGDL